MCLRNPVRLIVIFVGKPGTGKTTYMNIVYSLLRSKNVGTSKCYLKTIFIFTRIFLKIFKRFSFNYDSVFKIHRILVYLDLIANSLLLPFLALLRVKLRRGIVLVEEYVPGIVVDYLHALFRLKLDRKVVRNLLNILMKALERDNNNSLLIFLTCDDLELRRRQLLRGGPLEVPSYMNVQEAVFRVWLRRWRSVVINTNDADIANIAMRIANEIIKEYNRSVRSVENEDCNNSSK